MYENILIPVDGSEVSDNAARQGFELASRLGSKVTLFYAVDISILTAPGAESAMANVNVMRASLKEQADSLMASMKETAAASGIEPETLVAEGNVSDEIVRAANEKGADLIVMGTHGRRGFNRLLIGSVAESVSRKAHCPVLLIRPA